jgi:hypothetical protein
MRLAILLVGLSAAAATGCASSTPCTVVPGPQAVPIGVDAELAYYAAGRRSAFFLDTLRVELDRRNVRLIDAKGAPTVAEIDLGLANYGHVVDVYMLHGAQRTCAGRIRLPDTALTTLDVAADLVAEVIARSIVAPGAPGSQSCGG